MWFGALAVHVVPKRGGHLMSCDFIEGVLTPVEAAGATVGLREGDVSSLRDCIVGTLERWKMRLKKC